VDGQISIYGQRLSAASVTVNGQKATRLKFSGALGRGIRATAREAAGDDDESAEVVAAQTEGLDVYVPQLVASSRFAVRGVNTEDILRELDLDAVVEGKQRPW
jgi:hypothetical protein